MEPFLSHGARTDIRLRDPLDTRGHDGLLPLDIALRVTRMNSSGHSPLLPEWNFLSRELRMDEVGDCDRIDKSICNAIAFDDEEFLFSLIHRPHIGVVTDGLLPLEIALDVARVRYFPSQIDLSPKSSILQSIAVLGLPRMAVLLVVAREKVLVPITLSRQDGDGWDGSVTLLQCLENTMGSVFREEYRMGLFAEPEFHRKKLLLRAIAILLQVFERAGNAIEECIQLERHNDEFQWTTSSLAFATKMKFSLQG
ncbi:hypothetical protein RHMOL_Rhmol03G0109400 [Rhododendron molle]|uniref:Uncharacterized protein n=1 Tax=Rhododendron molle TaxID=49168 RepID=A0ACC0PFE7_RHOML|nr:hypothetical protein RHMOL_Rhmol03G0109400 [Rhododendron molle]